MSEGIYTWPNDLTSVAFPRLERPFKRRFGVRDRVLIHSDSLLEIEAQGSCVIQCFAAPDVALGLVADMADFDDAGLGGEIVFAAETRPGLGTVSVSVFRKGRRIEPTLEHLALMQAWLPSEVLQPGATRMEHLFVNPKEVEELLVHDDGVPVRHGNAVHNAARREQILAAALCLLHKSPGRFKTAVELAGALEGLPAEFWLDMQPPLGPRTMTELLACAIDTGKVLRERK